MVLSFPTAVPHAVRHTPVHDAPLDVHQERSSAMVSAGVDGSAPFVAVVLKSIDGRLADHKRSFATYVC